MYVGIEEIILSLFIATSFILVMYMFHKQLLTVIVSSHLLMFIAFFYFYQLVTVFMVRPKYDLEVFILTNLLIFLYILSVALIALIWKKRLIEDNHFFDLIRGIDDRLIFLFLAFWVIVKIYFVAQYGYASFKTLAMREEIGMSYIEAVLDSLMIYPAFGAFLSYFSSRVMGKRDRKYGLEIVLFICALLFFILSIVFSIELGVRRFFTFLVIIFVLISLHKANRKGINRILLHGVISIFVLLGFYIYYQGIRWNVYDPNINSQLLSGRPKQIVKGIGLSMVPDYNIDSALASNVESRPGPYFVLQQIVEEQVEGSNGTGGEFIIQSFRNSVPAYISRGKRYVDADEIFSSTYNLPPIDLGTNILSIFQSEFSFAGFLVTALFMMGLFVTYIALLQVRTLNNILLKITVIGLLYKTAYFAESSLDVVFFDIRNLFIIIMISCFVKLIAKLHLSIKKS